MKCRNCGKHIRSSLAERAWFWSLVCEEEMVDADDEETREEIKGWSDFTYDTEYSDLCAECAIDYWISDSSKHI